MFSTRSQSTRMRNSKWMDRADHLFASGQFQPCLTLLERILESDPDHVGALETRAKTLWAMGSYEGVIATTQTLSKLNSYEPGYHSLRGAALHATGRYSEALVAFKRSVQLGGEAQAEASAIFLQQCEHSLLNELLERDPDFREAYNRDPVSACQSKGITAQAHVSRLTAPSLSRPS